MIFHTITAIVLPTCDIIPGGLSFSLLVYLAVGLLNPSWNYLNELHLGVTVLSVWPISFLLPFSILVIFDLLLWFFFSLSPRWWFFLIDLPSDWSLKTKCAVIYRNIQYNQFIYVFLLIILILFFFFFGWFHFDHLMVSVRNNSLWLASNYSLIYKTKREKTNYLESTLFPLSLADEREGERQWENEESRWRIYDERLCLGRK